MPAPTVANQGGAGKPPSKPTVPERFGTWFFAVVAVIIMPLLPLLVEGAKNHFEIDPENLLLTTAVLAVGFGFSSESNMFRASYALLFFFSVGLDFHSAKSEQSGVDTSPVHPIGDVVANKLNHQDDWLFSHPGYFVFAVCIIHAIERLYWHIGERKKFPDWLR